jgi:L-ascorbate metabolism protein UlaG (beta-lactamase superfamily)
MMIERVTDPSPEPLVPPAPRPKKSRWRRRLIAFAVGLSISPVAFVFASLYALRHVPYSIPERLRAPSQPGMATGGLWVKYLGVTGYEITDGRTTLLLDPTFTRPAGLALLGTLEPDEALLARHVGKADFILVNHAHHDHALDVPAIAKTTGAPVYGSPSTLNLCRSRGVPEAQLHETRGGQHLTLGTFEVDVAAFPHTALLGIENPMAGVIAADAGPLRWWEYKQDGCLAFRLVAGGATLWFHPTTSHGGDGHRGLQAKSLILGVAGEPITPAHVREVLGATKPARVMFTHYDNFMQSREKGLALLPGLDLDAALAAVEAVAPGMPVWLLDFDQTVHLPQD